MESLRRIMAVLTFYIAVAESEISPQIAAGVVSAIQQRYLSGCVFLLQTSNKDLSAEESSVQLHLRKRLSEEGVQVAARIFGNNTAAPKCARNTPLNVLLSSGPTVKATLIEYSMKNNMAGATWLMFLTTDSIPSFFADIDVPFNAEFLVASQGAKRIILYEVYRVAKGMSLNDPYYSAWTTKSGLTRMPDSIYKRRGNLQGLVIKAVTGDDPPIVTLQQNNTIKGFFGLVWKILEDKMNFRTNYNITEDLTKGKPMNKQDCSGMIGMLQCGEADVALGAFSTSSYNSKTVKFSVPLIYTTNQLFIKKPAGRLADWDAFLKPFSPRLWFVLLATILTISLYLATFYNIGRRVGNEEAGGPELYTFYDSILYIFGAFCQQGHDITPRSTSCRLVYITAYLTALVLLAAYSAALISSLTVYSSNLPFSDLEGLLKENSYKVGVVSESEMFYTVSDDTDVGIFKDVYSRMLLDQENFPTTTLDGLHRVCKMKFAFMAYPESVLPLIRKVNCSIVPLPYKSYPISLAIAFRANNPYIDFFSYRLRMLRDGGIIHRLRIQNWPFLGQNAVKTSMVGVDLKAVAPLLALLASSVVVSVTILLVENGKFSYSNRHVKNAKTRLQRNMLRIQSVNRNSVKKKSIFYLFPWKLLPHNSRSNSRQHFHVWRD